MKSCWETRMKPPDCPFASNPVLASDRRVPAGRSSRHLWRLVRPATAFVARSGRLSRQFRPLPGQLGVSCRQKFLPRPPLAFCLEVLENKDEALGLGLFENRQFHWVLFLWKFFANRPGNPLTPRGFQPGAVRPQT